MIAIEVAAPFLIPFKLVLLLALVLAIPYILYQVWAFVAPGLYQNEKRLAMPLVVSSTLLFYLGMAFAYFVVFPLIFAFFTATAPEGVAVMTDISRYLDFIIMLFIAFGIAFEVPIATILLVSMGATTTDQLAAKRPYVIVGTFVVGMVLTPPDIISQTLLALPMWVLFEIGLILSRMMEKRKAEAERRAEAGLDDSSVSPEAAMAGGGATTGTADRKPASKGAGEAAARGAGAGASVGANTDAGAGSSKGGESGAGKAAAATAAAASPPSSGSAPAQTDQRDYRPLSAEEMDAELDRLEEEERRREEERRSEEERRREQEQRGAS